MKTNNLDLTAGGNDTLRRLVEQEPHQVVEDKHGEVETSYWPKDEDILELWRTYREAHSWTGIAPTLRDFGQWLSGCGDYDEPCKVVW